MRFDSKLLLDKGPALPPSHFQQRGHGVAASNNGINNGMTMYSSSSSGYPEHLCLAMDCEMVGVGPHHISVLARVSIVDFRGEIVYDTFVKVEEKVTDYRTAVSGIRPEDLRNGVPYGKCRSQVRVILAGKILVGHGLQNDLAVLNLRHPAHMIRDTSLYLPYSMQDFGSGIVVRSRSLRDLMRDFCGTTIQAGEHDSVEDARAAMTLYGLAKTEWDASASLSSYATTTSTATPTVATTATALSYSHNHNNHHNNHHSSLNPSHSAASHYRSTSGRKYFARPSAAAAYQEYHGYPQSYHRPATTFY
jgi:RNA exonuclease 4